MTSKKTQEALSKRTKNGTTATMSGGTNPATSTPPEVSDREREATLAYFRIIVAAQERLATALERVATIAERGHGLAVEQARREVAVAADAGTTHSVEVMVPPDAAKTTEAPGLKQAQQAFLDYVARHDKVQAAAVLKRFGAARVSELSPAQYGSFIAALAE